MEITRYKLAVTFWEWLNRDNILPNFAPVVSQITWPKITPVSLLAEVSHDEAN